MTHAERAYTLKELAERLGAEVHGDPECTIASVSALDNAGKGDITFLSNPKFRHLLNETRASAVIVGAADIHELSTNALVVDNPHLAFAQVAGWLYPLDRAPAGVHPQAIVDPDSQVHAQASIGPGSVVEAGAIIGAACDIGPGCVIGKNVVIEEGGRLVANVTLCHRTQIGRNVIIHPGVVIGADGFGLADDKGRWVKVPQVGRVIIGDDVEIGANTTIDRGAVDDTVIGNGVKLDNQIQIAHNVQIGDHTAIAGCVGIAGSTRIGKHCAIGGAVAIVGHLEVADNVTVTFMSCVTQSITRAGTYSSGAPLEENTKWRRNFVRMKQLDEMAHKIKTLEKSIKTNDANGDTGQA